MRIPRNPHTRSTRLAMLRHQLIHRAPLGRSPEPAGGRHIRLPDLNTKRSDGEEITRGARSLAGSHHPDRPSPGCSMRPSLLRWSRSSRRQRRPPQAVRAAPDNSIYAITCPQCPGMMLRPSRRSGGCLPRPQVICFFFEVRTYPQVEHLTDFSELQTGNPREQDQDTSSGRYGRLFQN